MIVVSGADALEGYVWALDPASVRLQHTDNAHTGFFWTRAPDTFQPGEQSPVESDGSR